MSGIGPGADGGTHTPGTTSNGNLDPLLIGTGFVIAAFIVAPPIIPALLLALGAWWWLAFRAGWLAAAGGGLALAAWDDTAGVVGDAAAASWSIIGPGPDLYMAALWPWARLGIPAGLIVAGLAGSVWEWRARDDETDGWWQRHAWRKDRHDLERARHHAAALDQDPGAVAAVIGATDLDRELWRTRLVWVRGVWRRRADWQGLHRAPWVVHRPGFARVLTATPAGRRKSMVVVGGTGSGKTEFLTRDGSLAASARVPVREIVTPARELIGTRPERLIFIDAKATEAELIANLTGLYIQHNEDQAEVRVFPRTPLDVWQGGPGEVIGRLLAVVPFSKHADTSAIYKEAAQRVLQMVFSAPGMPPPDNSGELLRRLSVPWVRHHLGDAAAAELGQLADGAILRYRNYFTAMGARFDGRESWGDADLWVVPIRAMGNQADADATIRMVLADLLHWVAYRKTDDRPVRVILDELAAVPGVLPMILDLIERGRSKNVSVVVSGQSYQALSPEDPTAADRLIAGAGGTLVQLGSPDPRLVERYAGTVRRLARSWRVADGRKLRDGTVRMEDRPRVEPGKVRGGKRGHGHIISGQMTAEIVGSKVTVRWEALRLTAEVFRVREDITPDGLMDEVTGGWMRAVELAARGNVAFGELVTGSMEAGRDRRGWLERVAAEMPMPVRELWAVLVVWLRHLVRRVVRRG